MSFWNKVQNIFNNTSRNNSKVVVAKDNNTPSRRVKIDKIDDFSKVLRIDDIIFDVDVDSRDELLKYLASFAQKAGIVSDEEAIYGKYLLRESQASTNLLDGVAIPHVQDESVLTTRILIIRLLKPIQWGNGKKVGSVISLLTPSTEENFKHVSYLAGIAARLLKVSFVESLAVSNKEKILKLFNQ